MTARSPDITRACVCAAGVLREPAALRPLAAAAGLLVAADGGARHLAAMGLRPHAVVGDLDSLGDDPWAGDAEVRRIRWPREKDACDGELAVAWALQEGCQQVLLIGAWGGRPDHTLGTCALLARHPGRLAVWEDGWVIQAVAAPQRLALSGRLGATVSLIALGEAARVRTHGLTYALADEPLRGPTHGLSNMIARADAAVTVTAGRWLVCQEGGDPWLRP